MKAQSISTPGRTKKIIATIWTAAISLSSAMFTFVSGVRIGGSEYVYISTIKTAYICLYQFKCNEMCSLDNLMN